MKKFTDEKPIYLQLRDEIEDAIVSGLYKPDDMLPSIRKIAQAYRLNPLTVSNAFSELVNEDLIYKKRGIGMFVSKEAQAILQSRKSEKFLNQDLPSILKQGKILGVAQNQVTSIVDDIYSSNYKGE